MDIYGPAELLCDNKSVVENSVVPASVLIQRQNSICCRQVREAHACGMITVQWITGDNNLVNFLSKTRINRNLLYSFVQEVFYNFVEKV